MNANVNGVFYGTKYASAQMITQEPLPSGDRGWILNAASVYGLVGTPSAPAYCTSKGAVANLTRAAALDCAPYRVHVNAVNPGYVATHVSRPKGKIPHPALSRLVALLSHSLGPIDSLVVDGFSSLSTSANASILDF